MADSPTLSDLRVIECAEGVAGPYCGKLFADLGADTIKVEPPHGDRSRLDGPFPDGEPHPERGGLFHYLNANKRGVALDLEAADGLEALERLAADADVLILDRTPPRLAAIGLDPEALTRAHERLVVVSATPFGLGGPRRDWAGGAHVVYQMSGMGRETPSTYVTDTEAEPPLSPGNPQADYLTGLTAAAAAMVALAWRDAYGRGQLVDISGVEANTNHVRMTWNMLAHNPDLMGGREKASFGMVVPCADGWVFLSPWGLDHWWLSLRRMMGEPEWARDEAYLTGPGRNEHVADIEPHVREWALAYTRDELYRMSIAHKIPCFPVYSPAEMRASPQFEARGFFVEAGHGEAGRRVQPGAPVRYSVTRWALDRPAPRLGEHNAEALAEAEAAPRGERGSTARAGAGSGGGARDRPLEGVRVLDFGWILSVPHATAWLGAFGAEVIRVESEARLDLIRAQGMTRGADGALGLNRSGAFNGLNYGKLGVTLNLGDPRGRELALRLAARCDVVTENFSSGVIERLGLGYEALREARPDIVMLSGSPLGQTGPEAAATGWGPTTLAYTGLPWITGYRGGPPAAYGGAYPDFAIGVQMAFSVLVALRERARSGRGQHIDLSMAETVAAMTPEPLLAHEYLGLDSPRDGNRHPLHAPQGVYRAAGDDRWLALTIETDGQWAALAEAMGRPAWALDARYASAAGRRAHHDAIDAGIEAWTRGREAEACAALLQSRGVPAGPSWGVRDLAADGDLRGRGYLATVDHAELGPREIAGVPGRFAAMPDRGYRPSPLIGEHNREVFGGLLGLSDAEIAELRAEGAIG